MTKYTVTLTPADLIALEAGTGSHWDTDADGTTFLIYPGGEAHFTRADVLISVDEGHTSALRACGRVEYERPQGLIVLEVAS